VGSSARKSSRRLFIANEEEETFDDHVNMAHAHPGCGGMVKNFGNNRTRTSLASSSLPALFQGTFVHPGYHLLLQW
jgi:hypothetical protein